MTRQTLHLLICLLLSLTLAGAGAVGAAARLSMAIATYSVTEVVICAEDGVHIVLLTAEGVPVSHGHLGPCARCADCCQANAATLPCPVGPDPIAQRLLVPAPAVPVSNSTLTRAVRLHQARAPPKEL